MEKAPKPNFLAMSVLCVNSFFFLGEGGSIVVHVDRPAYYWLLSVVNSLDWLTHWRFSISYTVAQRRPMHRCLRSALNDV